MEGVWYQCIHRLSSLFPWDLIQAVQLPASPWMSLGCSAPVPPRVIQSNLSPTTGQGCGQNPAAREAQLLPGPVCLLIMDNLFSHGLLPSLPASDSVDLKSASTSVLPGFWLGQHPHCQHTQACLQGRAWDTQPGSVTLLNLP